MLWWGLEPELPPPLTWDSRGTIRSDNGPQYSSVEFSSFTQAYRFKHLTSSLRYPQSKGQVDRMVKTMKDLIKKSLDSHQAVLSYRVTPLPWCELSPALHRPTYLNHSVTNQGTYNLLVKKANSEFKNKQKVHFTSRYYVVEQSKFCTCKSTTKIHVLVPPDFCH